jgi:hypothetical protein
MVHISTLKFIAAAIVLAAFPTLALPVVETPNSSSHSHPPYSPEGTSSLGPSARHLHSSPDRASPDGPSSTDGASSQEGPQRPGHGLPGTIKRARSLEPNPAMNGATAMSEYSPDHSRNTCSFATREPDGRPVRFGCRADQRVAAHKRALRLERKIMVAGKQKSAAGPGARQATLSDNSTPAHSTTLVGADHRQVGTSDRDHQVDSCEGALKRMRLSRRATEREGRSTAGPGDSHPHGGQTADNNNP